MKLLFYIFLTFLPVYGQAQIERRAAFDIGSGAIKLLVADVDTETQQVTKYLYGDSIKVPFSAYLAVRPDGSFGADLQAQTKTAIATLKHKAAPYHPQCFLGVATEAFRLAKNGQQLAAAIEEELGGPIYIISQSEEAELGFASAVAHANGDIERAIVWDIGNGSFQISWKEFDAIHSYTGKLGKVPTKNIILTIQNKEIAENTSPNPISQEETYLAKIALTKQLQGIPASLQQKLQTPRTQVYGIGGVHHKNIAVSTGKAVYTLSMVDELLMNRLGLEDSSFGVLSSTPYWVSDLVFVSCIMSHLGIQEVLDVQSFDVPEIPVTGNTVGILIREKYWDTAISR